MAKFAAFAVASLMLFAAFASVLAAKAALDPQVLLKKAAMNVGRIHDAATKGEMAPDKQRGRPNKDAQRRAAEMLYAMGADVADAIIILGLPELEMDTVSAHTRTHTDAALEALLHRPLPPPQNRVRSGAFLAASLEVRVSDPGLAISHSRAQADELAIRRSLRGTV